MTTQPDNQTTKSDTWKLLSMNLLWVLAGTVTVGVIWMRIAGHNLSRFGYYEGGFVLFSGFIVGGILGGLVTRFLPSITKSGRVGRALALIVPVLIIGLFIVWTVINDELFLLFLLVLGVLGASVVVWIPKWIKSLWRKYQGAWWVVVVAIALIILTLFCILMLSFGLMSQ
jgi:hypothetical protein